MNILLVSRPTIPGMAGRSMTPEQNDRVVERVREILSSPEWNQSTLAPRLGVKQTSISSLLAGRHRASFPFAMRLAELLQLDVFDLIEGRAAKAPLTPSPSAGGPRWRDLPWWSEVIAIARKMAPRVSALSWERLGNLMGEMPPSRDPATLAMLALGWDQAASDNDRAAADAALSDREMAEEDAEVDDLLRRRAEARRDGRPLPRLPDDVEELPPPPPPVPSKKRPSA